MVAERRMGHPPRRPHPAAGARMTADRSDDSPALGGRSDDNAPMISSVLTHVIVSARGAYAARNLDALIEFMTAEQRKQFRHAIVEQAYALAHQVLLPDY